MTNPFQSRHAILWAIILFYSFPILGLCAYLKTFIPLSNVWNVFSGGLLIAFVGSMALFWIMYSRELVLKAQMSVISSNFSTDIAVEAESALQTNPQIQSFIQQVEELQQQLAQLRHEIEMKEEALGVLQRDKEVSQHHYEQIYNDYNYYKNASQDQLKQHKSFIQELQGTIDQQRILIEKKQQQIAQLETKVGDLTYEIKTLLHLAESTQSIGNSLDLPKEISTEVSPVYSEHNDSSFLSANDGEEENSHFSNIQVYSCDSAMIQLKRCLDIAQKMTGSTHFGTSRFRDLAVDNFALDLRRLCDSLRSENNSAILLYSPKEDKLLFANNQVKALLGWSPEKLIQNFTDIIQEGEQEWKHHLSHISLKSEMQVKLLLKTKKGHDLLVHCHLGIIPTGVFRYHVIGILHPA